MTRKDYELIARALRPLMWDDKFTAAVALADAIAREHPRFDRNRFLRACGVGVL